MEYCYYISADALDYYFDMLKKLRNRYIVLLVLHLLENHCNVASIGQFYRYYH